MSWLELRTTEAVCKCHVTRRNFEYTRRPLESREAHVREGSTKPRRLFKALHLRARVYFTGIGASSAGYFAAKLSNAPSSVRCDPDKTSRLSRALSAVQ